MPINLRKLYCSSAFIAAFLIDVLLVGPLVKDLVFRFLKDHHKR